MKAIINRKQIVTIQKYKRWAQLDDPTYRDLLDRAAGVRSSKLLDQVSFERTMGWLETLLFDRVDAGIVAAPSGVIRTYWRDKLPTEGMINSRLRYTMERWWGLLADYLPQEERNETYLAGIIRKAAGKALADILHEGCLQWERVPKYAGLLCLEAIKDRLRHAIPKGAAA